MSQDVEMAKPHDWVPFFVSETREESKNTFYQCAKCRLVKHVYEYPLDGDINKMSMSPNYPMYYPADAPQGCTRSDLG